MKNKNVVSGIDSLCAVGLITNFNYIQSVYAHLKKKFYAMLCIFMLCHVILNLNSFECYAEKYE